MTLNTLSKTILSFNHRFLIVASLILFGLTYSFASSPIYIRSYSKTSSLRPIWLDSSKVGQRSLSQNYPYFAFDSTANNEIFWHPLSGAGLVEYGENKWGYQTQVGLWLEAHRGSFYGWVDSRIYSMPLNFDLNDGQFTDEQSGKKASYDYKSFGRYVGLVAFSTESGDFYFGRDAQNWGPARYSALVFNGQAIPYDQAFYEIAIGDFKVRSLWGILDIREDSSEDTLSDKSRHVYGHRYEWQPTKNFKLGISEQTIVYDFNSPQFFIPVFPLFIAKSYIPEDKTNGNIAIDFEWLIASNYRTYGEILSDDMESPFTLFTKNYIQNKWAATFGFEYSNQFNEYSYSILLEGLHIEPWVYTHFYDNTVQAAHGSMPIGVIQGPAYQRILLDFSLASTKWISHLIPYLHRKGNQLGSNWKDLTPRYHKIPKKYFGDAPWEFGLDFTYAMEWKYAFIEYKSALLQNADPTHELTMTLKW